MSFYAHGCEGSLICDTGTSVSTVTLDFVKRAGLAVRPLPRKLRGQPLTTPSGVEHMPVGCVDMEVAVQLMLDVEGVGPVTWDRMVMLKSVWVADFGTSSPRDLYISYGDWGYHAGEMPTAPLSQLAYLVAHGAKVLNTPRVPRKGDHVDAVSMVQGRSREAVVHVADAAVVASIESATPEPAARPPAPKEASMTDAEMEAAIRARLGAEHASTLEAGKLVQGLLLRRKIFTEVDPAECTETVEFELMGEPKEVSFKVPASRKAGPEAYASTLDRWEERGIIVRVSADTPSYGFAIVVPKPGGAFRVTINPTGVNSVTSRVEPEGGFMPDNMIMEAMTAGTYKYAVKVDWREAFTTLKLGPIARRLSTFTTPKRKYQWQNGYFGWHGFPACFQKLVMTKVVLPTLEEFQFAGAMLAWIDDLVIVANDLDTLVRVTLSVVDRVLAVGGRLSLGKCNLLVPQFEWCGVQVNLNDGTWRIDPGRVSSLMDTPLPADREALRHIIGVIRYYFHGVPDHVTLREHVAKLSELDYEGSRVRDAWTPEHTEAMYAALRAVTATPWLLVYDPRKPVFVSTDASGNHGYSIVANQWDARTGERRPIMFFSRGWIGPQLGWHAQIKECYAQWQAVVFMMPQFFPYAPDVRLLCDNKNLASAKSVATDHRVRRWQADIRNAGVVRYWITGARNVAADMGSRAVQADETADLTKDEEFELYVYALSARAAGPEVPATAGAVVLGHEAVDATLRRIMEMQSRVSDEERRTWRGPSFKTVTLAGMQLVTQHGHAVVPREAHELQAHLLRMAHDDNMHYMGVAKTVYALKQQCKVTWVGMEETVERYIRSCYKCTFAKAPSHEPAMRGRLTPTIAPYIHHTWYADIKGPMPHHTGSLLVVVESITRMVRLRYLPDATAAQVVEELMECIISFGTRPRVIRSDGGQPFDSAEYKAFCEREGITPVIGVPYHSQGQGKVESRIRSVAAALMATLGHKAPLDWFKKPYIADLEGIINNTHCAPLGGSPYWAMTGMQARTRESTVDWTSAKYGADTLGIESLTANDVSNIIAEHHAVMDAVHGRVRLATSLAQALTKERWDRAREASAFTAGDHVLVHRDAPNRMLPHFAGPYVIDSVSADGNFVKLSKYVNKAEKMGPVHVSRLLRFDASRTTPREVSAYHLESGYYMVKRVVEHRVLANHTLEFHIEWEGTAVTSWSPAVDLKKVTVVQEYCEAHGLPSNGVVKPKAEVAEVVGADVSAEVVMAGPRTRARTQRKPLQKKKE